MKTLLLIIPQSISILIFVAIVLVYLYGWFLILKDIINSEFNPPMLKFIWLVVVFIFGIFGGILYIFFGKQTKYYD